MADAARSHMPMSVIYLHSMGTDYHW